MVISKLLYITNKNLPKALKIIIGILTKNNIYSRLYPNMYSPIKALDNAILSLV